MRATQNSKIVKTLVGLCALSVLVAGVPTATAATKTITCYKGSVVKKVTGIQPKCPTGYTRTITCYKGTVVKKVTARIPKCPIGYSRTKPTATPTATPKPTSTVKPTPATVAFSGTYTGKISLLWGDNFVQATSVEAIGVGNILGLTELSGIGSAAPASQCDTFNGSGTLSGGGNTLKVTFDSTAKACAEDADAPTGITFTGNALINGGTGKFAGATGTLKVTAGAFAIKATVAGKSEIDVIKFTISGNINTK